jgi:hypothetical protein
MLQCSDFNLSETALRYVWMLRPSGPRGRGYQSPGGTQITNFALRKATGTYNYL